MKTYLSTALIALSLVSAQFTHADEPAAAAATTPKRTPVEWNWNTFTPAEVSVTAAGVGAMIGSLFITPTAPHWTATNPVDEAGRNALRLSSPSARNAGSIATDVGVGLTLAVPVVGGAIQWLKDKNDENAAKKAGMIVMSVSFTLGLDGMVKNLVARARPCTRDGDSACTPPDSYRSFFSGHTASAFTGAALCWKENLGWALCTADTVAAAAVGIGRMAVDDHYLSDVLVGAVVGSFSGAVLPWLTNIQLGPRLDVAARESDTRDKRTEERAVNMSILPSFSAGSAVGGYNGLMLQGTF